MLLFAMVVVWKRETDYGFPAWSHTSRKAMQREDDDDEQGSWSPTVRAAGVHILSSKDDNTSGSTQCIAWDISAM
jgi:hypothetical protein